MKIKLLFISVFAFIHSSYAQVTSVNWGDLNDKATAIGKLFINANGEVIKISYETKNRFNKVLGMEPITNSNIAFITKYNSKLKEEKSTIFKINESNVGLEDYFFISNKLYVTYRKYLKQDSIISYYAQAINTVTLENDGEAILLGSFPVIYSKAYKQIKSSEVCYRLSPDSSKFLIFAELPYQSGGDKPKYKMNVFSNTFNKLWEKDIEIDNAQDLCRLSFSNLGYTSKYEDIFSTGNKGVFVSNLGDVGLSFVFNKTTKKDVLSSFKNIVFLYKATENKPKEFELNIPEKYAKKAEVFINNSNNLMVFGMCADKYKSNLNNYFISITDVATGNIIFKKIAPLPSNLIDDIAIDRQASVRESSYGLYNDFKLRDVLIRANGSVDYLFEFYQDVDHFGNVDDADARRSLQITDCLCGDIIDINITNTGKAIFTRIPKLQAAIDFSLASGFIATTYNNKLLLFYNDDADNLTKDLSRKPDVCSKFGKSSFTMAVIDEKGSLTRQAVFSNQGMPVTCCTCKCSKGLNNKIVIYAQKIDALSASADMVGSIDIK